MPWAAAARGSFSCSPTAVGRRAALTPQQRFHSVPTAEPLGLGQHTACVSQRRGDECPGDKSLTRKWTVPSSFAVTRPGLGREACRAAVSPRWSYEGRRQLSLEVTGYRTHTHVGLATPPSPALVPAAPFSLVSRSPTRWPQSGFHPRWGYVGSRAWGGRQVGAQRCQKNRVCQLLVGHLTGGAGTAG